ncbi:PIF1-like helicase-domain-containing protein [Jimgerdemannia flammicorona]|uniref:ATP-dependent DNA helicase n=1 Tax=Jimgerdemannia flammicorona TaxID=994334 RepID=A0A433DDQ0_9FUNG|nr:PIF1-like helicase-domain-containing protein [Jimgerdemannia flammicorona]
MEKRQTTLNFNPSPAPSGTFYKPVATNSSGNNDEPQVRNNPFATNAQPSNAYYWNNSKWNHTPQQPAPVLPAPLKKTISSQSATSASNSTDDEFFDDDDCFNSSDFLVIDNMVENEIKKQQLSQEHINVRTPGGGFAKAVAQITQNPVIDLTTEPTATDPEPALKKFRTTIDLTSNANPHNFSPPAFGRHNREPLSNDTRLSALAHTGEQTSKYFRESKGIVLSDEQKYILKMVVEQRQSLFFTGSAEIIAQLTVMFSSDELGIAASTGIAACNIGGSTLHSFAGIGLGTDPILQLCNRVKGNRKVSERWRRVKALIIDENGDLFDKIEAVAREVRGDPQPFGGLQVIITGDFFQLPPVRDRNGRGGKFAFEAKTWPLVVKKTVEMRHVFRQKDGDFVHMLNELRLGKVSVNTLNMFRSLCREPKYPDDGIVPTYLYSYRSDVDVANNRQLAGLKGDVHRFSAQDWGDLKKIQDQCLAPQILELKLSAQVMLLKNLDTTLVNGSIGTVIGFNGEGKYMRDTTSSGVMNEDGKLAEGEDRGSGSAVGLKEPGQKQGQGQANEGNPNQKSQEDATPYPIVKFTNGREYVCLPEEWRIELPGKLVVTHLMIVRGRRAWHTFHCLDHISLAPCSSIMTRWTNGCKPETGTIVARLGVVYPQEPRSDARTCQSRPR